MTSEKTTKKKYTNCAKRCSHPIGITSIFEHCTDVKCLQDTIDRFEDAHGKLRIDNLRQNHRWNFIKSHLTPMVELEQRMPLFSERQTETGNVDYYSPWNELNNQIWHSSTNLKYLPSYNGTMTSKTILLTSIIAITAILGFSVISQQAHAVTNYVISSPDGGDCTFLGGSWVPATNTCTIASKIIINGGNSLTVSQGATLEILDEIAIAYQSSLTNNGDIIIVSGGHIGLNGFDDTSGNNMLTNNGNIINSGSIFISFYGNILTNFGSITNLGAITNFGTFNNACEGSLVGTIPTSGNSVIQEESCNNTIQVNIDIKPGSFPNSINTNSMGVVPVSILGSNSFDVTQVDVTTLAFGPDGASPTHSAYEDVNGDEFVDLISHYVQKETGIACGDTEATLTGQLNGGTPIEGTDSVNPSPCLI